MARHLDWDKPITVRTDTNVALRERVLLRLDAEAWYATLLDKATKKDRWPTFVDQQERWLARVLLGMAPRWRLALVHSNVIRWQLNPYGAFEPWLQDRIDPRRLTQIKETLRLDVRDTCASLYWSWQIILFGLALFGLMLVTRFGRSSSRAIRAGNPSPLAWWLRAKQQARLRGIPSGLAAARPVLVLTLRIFFFALVLVLAIACAAAAVLFPPLGVAIVIVGFVMRRKKRKA
jgi:hypothetical protein